MTIPSPRKPDADRESAVTSESKGLRLVFIGWGAVAQATAAILDDHGTPASIVAVATRNATRSRFDLPPEALALAGPRDLGRCEADLVIEAASSAAVAPWGRVALEAGIDFVVTSVSAFADAEVLTDLEETAFRNNAQIHISPGALGGVDALAAARFMGIGAVEHQIIKPPSAWRRTPAEDLCDLHLITDATAFFRGTAAEAASKFPENANSVLTTALAGPGPGATRVTLIADPNVDVNSHAIRAEGEFGELSIFLRNKPLDQNPKSSAMTALSLVRCINERLNPVVV